MNAQAAEIFRAARANAQTIPGTEKTAAQYLSEMAEIKARVTVQRIISNFDPSLLSAKDRWERLTPGARAILTSYQAAGGGSYVPFTTGESP
jgi:hypothetical protein